MRKRKLKDEDYVNSISNVVDLLFKARRLEKKINKAIEYIESYNLPKDLGKLSEAPISVNELKELLKILKEEK